MIKIRHWNQFHVYRQLGAILKFYEGNILILFKTDSEPHLLAA